MNPPVVRRLLHAATAALLLLSIHSLTALRVGTLVVAIAAAGLELVRLRIPAVQQRLARLFPVFRPRETTRISGAAWLAVGYAVAAWLPPPGPAAGILAGALADPAGSWIGGRWGGGVRKSWPGSAAVLGVAALGAFAAGLALPGAAATAILAAALERWPGPFDDNLLVAPGVAALAALVA